MRLVHLDGHFAIARLEPMAETPSWARGTFVSITRTPDELSIVCDESGIPSSVRAERGWQCLKVRGPIPFEVTGVAAALTQPLAAAGISLFLVSTYDTDYLLVKDELFAAAVNVLRDAGHDVAIEA